MIQTWERPFFFFFYSFFLPFLDVISWNPSSLSNIIYSFFFNFHWFGMLIALLCVQYWINEEWFQYIGKTMRPPTRSIIRTKTLSQKCQIISGWALNRNKLCLSLYQWDRTLSTAHLRVQEFDDYYPMERSIREFFVILSFIIIRISFIN